VLISIANIALFLYAESHGSTTTSAILLRFGADESLHVWAGEPWRLVTSMFLHIGWAHLLWNTYMGFGWCAGAERALGSPKFSVAYLLSGVGASAVSVLVHRVISAGASGAVFGIAGISLVLQRRTFADWRTFFAHPAARRNAFSLLLWVGLGFYLPMDQPAHLGGLVTGAALGWLFTAPSRSRPGWATFAVAYVALVLLATKPWGFHPTAAEAENLWWYGTQYATGEQLAKNETRAERFLRLACQAGTKSACFDLGRLVAK
jgi:rhomboid protease GluP